MDLRGEPLDIWNERPITASILSRNSHSTGTAGSQEKTDREFVRRQRLPQLSHELQRVVGFFSHLDCSLEGFAETCM